MPKDKDPLTPRQIALIRQWIDQGARANADVSARAAALGGAARARRAGRARARSGRLGIAPLDRFVAKYLASHRRPRSRRSFRMRCSRGASISTSGDCCRRRSSCRRSSPIGTRTSARRSSRRCSPTTRSTPSTGSRSGTICCATRTASPTFPRPPGARASPTGCSRRSRATCPYDQFVTRLLNPTDARRSRRVPHRRELARRDERRGDAVDAGVAEHGAGVPRHQPEVQRLPRQLRQQVEAEGRVRARGVLLARADAAAVSLRRRAESVRRSRPFSFPS